MHLYTTYENYTRIYSLSRNPCCQPIYLEKLFAFDGGKRKKREGEGGKKKLTLVRIDLPLYPRLIQDARITRVYPLIELSREKIYSLVKTKHGCVLKLCVPACVLAAWFGDTSTVLLKATFHRPRDIKGGHTDPESAGYRIVPSPTDRHRDAY